MDVIIHHLSVLLTACFLCFQCCEMMRLLGIPFVKSDGEAEAMCAWLNENNVSYQARHCQSPVSECPCQGQQVLQDHRIKIHTEGPLTSEALKFLASRMSHCAC